MSASSQLVDPTRTTSRRRRWVQAFNSRWSTIRGDLRDAIEREDRFGIADGGSTAETLSVFREWLRVRLREVVVEPESRQAVLDGRHWTGQRVRDVFEHGLKRADTALRTNGYSTPSSEPAAVLGAAISGGSATTTVDYADLLETSYERVVRDLNDDVRQAQQAVVRAVDEGVSNDDSLRDIANAATERVSAVGQTETVKLVHGTTVVLVNEAALKRYEAAGVEEVGVIPEARPVEELPADERRSLEGGQDEFAWQTAGDSRVCAECAQLAGRTWPLAAFASGEAPLPVQDTHVRCRCFLTPA